MFFCKIKIRVIYLFFFLAGLIILSCKKDNSASVSLDTYDYKSDIIPMATFFQTNQIQYFAEYGLPALVVNSNHLQQNGLNATLPFQTIVRYFDVSKVNNAISNNLWQAAFINKFQSYLGTPSDKWIQTILFFGNQLLQLYHQDSNNPQVGVLYGYLGEGIRHAVKDSFFVAVGWNTNISDYQFPSPLNSSVCTCVMMDEPCEKDTLNLDDEVVKVPWKEYTPTMFPAHKYDGKCAALATGLCATKLKLIPDSVDLDIWKNLSKAIGALPGGGAQMATINKYYTDKGFGVTVAANKDGETAIQQAKKALDRGCDVKIVFNDNAKTKGHVEYVTNIEVDESNTSAGMVFTRTAGIADKQKFNNGSFSEKESYETKEDEWLSKPGIASFYIYCKK